jgi:hypothetical protein
MTHPPTDEHGTIADRENQPSMTDTSSTSPTTTSNSQSSARPPSGTDEPDSRLARFERDLEEIGHRTSRHDRRYVVAGLVAMAAGIAVAVVAYATSTSQSDTRDVISSVILAAVGLSIVIAGGAVFVRSSLTEFLRFWMLRMLYEQQRDRRSDR